MGESLTPLVLLTIVLKFSVITALSPYPLLQIPCDVPCYKNRLLEQGAGANGTFVCGTNGVTYLNLEEMSCVRKTCKTDIRLWTYGRCPRLARQDASSDTNLLQFLSQMNQKPQTASSYGQNYNKYLSQTNENEFSALKVRKFPIQSRNGKKVCIPDDCGCPEELQPICGSDSVTYGNECLMKCNKLCSPDVMKFHDGHCGKLFFKQSCIPDECGCPDELEPVCGSDHVTYGNKCLLECNRNCNPDVIYNHDGYCGRLFFPKTSSKS